MDKFLLAYIKQRMKEMGICHFHYEPLLLSVSKESQQFNAYNEFLFLTGFPVAKSLQIISDTNIFTGDGGALTDTAGVARYSFSGVQEFSGLIEISFSNPDLTKNTFLEFIHVVPTCTENFCVKRKCCEAPVVK